MAGAAGEAERKAQAAHMASTPPRSVVDPWFGVVGEHWSKKSRASLGKVINRAFLVPLYPLALVLYRLVALPGVFKGEACKCQSRAQCGQLFCACLAAVAVDALRLAVWALVSAPVWLGLACLFDADAARAPGGAMDALTTSVDVWQCFILTTAALVLHATYK